MGGERSASEQKGVMQWTGTLLRNVACFRLRSAGLAMWFVHGTAAVTELSGADLGGGCRGCAQLVFCKKIKTMWFIGVEVEQETSAAPPKKILDPPLIMAA